jgi:hypothetical protein
MSKEILLIESVGKTTRTLKHMLTSAPLAKKKGEAALLKPIMAFLIINVIIIS